MNTNASNFVEQVDLAFYVIIGISLILLIGVTAVMIYFVVRYNKKKNPTATQIEGNNKLELIWTIIPTILVLIMFYYGWVGYEPMRNVPDDAIEVKAIGRMWSWTFEYDNGLKSDKLIVPLNKAVKLNLVSMDVNHALYIPAFRIKEDVVPGRNNFMWFEAQKLGSYDIFCAEYCGQRHAYMITKCDVIPVEEYNSWYAEGAQALANPSDDPVEAGYNTIKANGCIACHSTDGTKLVGPSFKGIFGTQRVVVTGDEERTVTVDEAYIINSIKHPNDDVVKDYMKGLMPGYDGQISDEDMDKIVFYIKSLGE
ncbi:MAG: cytochrome c oxidase subunit II [Bacteroidales bacterium]|nr:cytochrome c oxidase subunit II [Bacteroidales bacterium]MCF8456686.1 cytochrome c oxidase subunit II [Bacteroidales bacterium]